mgnify:CR=1 FL=1
MFQKNLLGEGEIGKLLTLQGEKVLFAAKKHWFVLARKLFVLFSFSLLSVLLTVFLFTGNTFIPSPTLLLATILCILLIATSFASKLIVDWYCHLYIVTTRRILEVCYAPLFSDNVSAILLDQVRVTEVDVQKNGIINEIFDVGNIIITFDRPTHQQECMLSDIQNTEKIGIFLGSALVDEHCRHWNFQLDI